MKRQALSIAVFAALTVAANGAIAQTGPATPAYKIPDGSQPEDKDGPRPIQLADGVELVPYFNAMFGRDDNLYLNSLVKKSSELSIYNPGFRLKARGESSEFMAGYDLKAGKYGSSSGDDYTDYRLFATGDFVLSSSMGLRLAGEHLRGHDPRGSTDRAFAASPDEYRNSGGSALFAYGANDATGRVEVEAGTFDRRYLNNRTTTQVSDRATDSFAGRFFLKVAPKTSLVFEYRQDKIDYQLSSSVQDSKEKRALVGVTWEATAATSGTFKVGQIKKDFDFAARKDYSGTGWEASIEWKPLSYSKVDLFTSKSFNESTGVGDFVLTKRHGAFWTHEWDSRLTSVLFASRSDDEFLGNPRTDKTDSFGLKLNYKVLRWFTVGGEYTSTKRDSNISTFNYKRNLYMLTLGASL